LKALVSIVVIDVSLFGIPQYLIGLGSLLESLLGLLFTTVAVRVVFQSQFSIIGLDFIFIGIAANAEDLIVVPLSPHRFGYAFLFSRKVPFAGAGMGSTCLGRSLS
jgi:hypothetical protein